MAFPEQQNLQRTAGKEIGKVTVTWRPNGAGAPLNAFAAGNTVRRLRRTGAGTWEITFRAGILTQAALNNTITKRMAHLSDRTVIRAVVGALTVTNGELVALLVTEDAAGTPTDVAASDQRFISMELEAEMSSSNPPPDLLV